MQDWTKSQVVFVVAVAVALIAGATLLLWWPRGSDATRANPDDPAQVAMGRTVYATRCASCHGDNLQGQPDWRERKPDGKLPAPPHDASGHSWHHPDQDLFGITKRGIAAYAPPGYRSDMPAFGNVLTDAEIWAVVAYIKSRWPPQIRQRQDEISRRVKGG